MTDEHDGFPSHEVMTLREVADYLQLAEKSILRMAQAGKIPAAKIASQWRFMRSLVQDWLASQMDFVPSAERSAALRACPPEALPPLSGLLRPDLMGLAIPAGTKKEILTRLVEPLEVSRFLTNSKPFLNTLIRREMLASTAIGGGVAIPHPRVPIRGLFKDPAIAFGLCCEGTDFDAVDGMPVYLFFLICASREEVHLRMMAQLSFLIRKTDVVGALKKATSPAEVTEFLRREESLSPRTS